MSWMQKLYETYEACAEKEQFSNEPLMPISHTKQQIHVEITINGVGDFKGARLLQKEETLIPATEASAGRSGKKVAPHPLCDKIQYCGKDYPDFGGKKASCFAEYELQLDHWCGSEFQHPKAKAVLSYVRKGTLVNDLINERILFVDDANQLLTGWYAEDSPEIFKMLTSHPKTKEKDQGDVFIRWNVRSEGERVSGVWEDESLQQSWMHFDASQKESKGLCFITGKEIPLSGNHPRRIRNPGDGAKLISSNDSSGFTFRGRFTDDSAAQACGVGFETTQKAHNALRWLIHRQGYRNGDQVIVSWSVGGKSVPDPFQSSQILFGEESEDSDSSQSIDTGDTGQSFALKLKKALAGYRANLDVADDIVVMGLDSAAKGHGRIAITYYREMNGSEFLDRIELWHEQMAWLQNFGKNAHFVGAPSPKDIAEAAYGRRLDDKLRKVTAYGRRLDDKLRKVTVERLLPCIVDGRLIPSDLVRSVSHRATNRAGLDRWEWEKSLGIACSLLKGFYKERRYQMALEQDRTTRDYLFGRLLAIADNVEGFALTNAEKGRDTMAGRLMQRFADRPFSTWRSIELALTPYKSRLRSSDKTAGFLYRREKLLDEVLCAFQAGDFTNDRALTGEFLLGFHCQRSELFKSTDTNIEKNNKE